MKTVLTFKSGTSVAVTVADLEALFPGQIAPIPAINGIPLTVGQTVDLPGAVLSILADEEVKKAEDTP